MPLYYFKYESDAMKFRSHLKSVALRHCFEDPERLQYPPNTTLRGATMTDLPPISDETLDTLKKIPTQTLIDGLWVKGWPMSYIEGARALQEGQHMAGRAVTLRFVPHRPDLVADKPKGDQSAEYVAIELCGPGEVLVIDAMGWKYSSVGGDIKFMRMMQRKAGGLVTDGAARDSVALKDYGFPVYSASTTAKQGPAEFWPWQVNDAIQCGGVLVRPGDAVVGDDDGAVVVPRSVVDEVIEIAHEREAVEEVIKAQLEIEQCSPGKYYPFNDLTWKLYEEKTGKKPRT
jgi:regulator of RNase E activity RraA